MNEKVVAREAVVDDFVCVIFWRWSHKKFEKDKMGEMVNTSALESLQLFPFSDQKTTKHINLLGD